MNAGIDIGYSATKAIVSGRIINFLSVIGTPDRARFSLNEHANDDIVLDLPDGMWLVGQGAVEQSRFLNRREDRAWIESDEYRRLMLAAFTELTAATSVDLVVVTGLPVAFYGDKGRLQAVFEGQHRATRQGRRSQLFRVTECRVIPQPFGALLTMALDDRGHVADSKLAEGAVGVVDVGGKTTNLLSVNRLTEIARETASVNVGAWDVMRAVRDHLSEHCPNLEVRDHQIMEAIIARKIKYYGQSVDLGPVVDTALAPLAGQVVAQATQLWNGGAALDAILVSGGGALLLGPHIQHQFPHAQVVDDPVFANARGFWKLAQRIGR